MNWKEIEKKTCESTENFIVALPEAEENLPLLRKKMKNPVSAKLGKN
jgi:hypothetical protein